MHSQINFGYAWPFSYGHLIIAVVALALFALGWVRKWHKLLLSAIGALTLWAFVAFLLVRFGFDMNGRATLPTQAFLSSGSGKVLDMGAGTGRSGVMVLEARPQTTLVALDSFGESYEEHFGKTKAGESVEDQGRQKLLANLKAAGLEQRATIQPGDMRHMPFEPATFDAAVSAYAIDHLNGEGARQALSEAPSRAEAARRIPAHGHRQGSLARIHFRAPANARPLGGLGLLGEASAGCRL